MPRRMRILAKAVPCLLALSLGSAWAFDIPPPPPPLFEGLIVPLHPQGPYTLPTRASTSRDRPAAPSGKAVSTLATGSSQLAATARDLAQAFPAANQAEMIRVYQQSFDIYRKLEAKLGIPPNDVAGALAAFIAGNHMALHNVEVPDAHFQRLVGQMRDALAQHPGFARASPTQKRQLYEQLAMVGTFMAVARMAFAQQPNPQAEQHFREAARSNLETAFRQSVDRVHITANGLSLQ